MKQCSKCQQSKPLDAFYPRKDARDGRRGTCIECWLAHYRPAKRVHYARHRERILADKRAHPERRRINDARYHLRHRDKRNSKSRTYYRHHRERIIEQAIARRKLYRSLDYGWTEALPNDRIQYGIWINAESARQRREAAKATLVAIAQKLTDEQRKFLAVFERSNMDIQTTVEQLGLSIEQGQRIMLRIRAVAVRVTA